MRLALKWSIWYNYWEAREIKNQMGQTMHLLEIKIPQADARGTGWYNTPQLKNPRSLVNSTTKSFRLSRGSYQASINPLEEVANMNKLEKSYFIKIKTSKNRVDSNAIITAMEARARQRRLEFKIEKLEQETPNNIPSKI